ncbi:unnamed protein product, partial [Ceratitis capitata]
ISHLASYLNTYFMDMPYNCSNNNQPQIEAKSNTYFMDMPYNCSNNNQPQIEAKSSAAY